MPPLEPTFARRLPTTTQSHSGRRFRFIQHYSNPHSSVQGANAGTVQGTARRSNEQNEYAVWKLFIHKNGRISFATIAAQVCVCWNGGKSFHRFLTTHTRTYAVAVVAKWRGNLLVLCFPFHRLLDRLLLRATAVPGKEFARV